MPSPAPSPLAAAVLMVRPACFGFNAEAAATNVFAGPAAASADAVAARARAEVERAADAIAAVGVRVLLGDDTPDPPRPDACFPNNWVSFHPDGTAVLYPMAVASRRAERRPELLALAAPVHGTRRTVDLTGMETVGAFLEGTGSLILDHGARRAYAARSPRTTPRGLAAFAEATGYRVVAFDAALDGAPVYHTNVVMALGPDRVVYAPTLIPAGAERDALERALGGRQRLALEPAQVRSYAANLLYLRGSGGPVAVLSRRAHDALTVAQRAWLGACVVVDIDTVEDVGGGSARCLLAEVFEP